jgi:hypothetical protein
MRLGATLLPIVLVAACTSFGSTAGAPNAAGNIDVGGDFESVSGPGCGNWEAERAALITSPNAHGGRWSCRACENSNVGGDEIDVWIRPLKTVAPPIEGKVYQIDAWAKVESGNAKAGQALFDVNTPDGGSEDQFTMEEPADVGSDWVHLQYSLPAPGGLTSLGPGLHFEVASRTCIDFDDFTVNAN